MCALLCACLSACLRACCLQVRHMLASHGRLHEVTQVILNPSDEPYFNVISTMSNKEDVKVRTLTAVACCVHGQACGLRSCCLCSRAKPKLCACLCAAAVLQHATTGAGCSSHK
jgi:hypothetical protein